MLLLHMQIRRYFNKICDKPLFVIVFGYRLFIDLFIFLIVHWLMIDHCLVFVSIKITYLLTCSFIISVSCWRRTENNHDT